MIYAQQKNGSRHYIHQVSAPAVIGDMEFLYQQESGLLIEAKKTVICVALQTELYRTVLEEDATFLRFLLHSVKEKGSILCEKMSRLSKTRHELFFQIFFDFWF